MKKSIFYFDSNAGCLERFRGAFGGEYEIRPLTTLSEARRALTECATDVIISEQNVPDISGLDFLREAAETCPRSYRVMLTGEPVLAEAIREVSTGVIHVFIPKPWTVENMRQVLDLAEMQFRSLRKSH